MLVKQVYQDEITVGAFAEKLSKFVQLEYLLKEMPHFHESVMSRLSHAIEIQLEDADFKLEIK